LATGNRHLAKAVFGARNGDVKCCKIPLVKGKNSHNAKQRVAVLPQGWPKLPAAACQSVVHYKKELPIPLHHKARAVSDSWLCISNGRFLTRTTPGLIKQIVRELDSDIMAVNVLCQLKAAREKVLTHNCKTLIGFRRVYDDSVHLVPVGTDWPHHLFIKTGALHKLDVAGALPIDFRELVNRALAKQLTVRGVNVGGSALDLDTAHGLLTLLESCNNSVSSNNGHRKHHVYQEVDRSVKKAASARVVGTVLIERDVTIGENAIIVGPAIIGAGATVSNGAAVRTSIIGPGVSIGSNRAVSNHLLLRSGSRQKFEAEIRSLAISATGTIPGNFRNWPRFSYARFFKRIFDIIGAVVALIFFAPVVPFITLAVKLTSPGPVFFADVRQGLHGKKFKCLKFRTMVSGASKTQEKLRGHNRVDGPQFKMDDDPRITTVGRFLRVTYLDEIPQLLNVLFGQMSLVGPRPSPESENTLCPFWRDARLSVRPGITGLWQVRRTRKPGKDFQEWIHYDTRYVRNLCLKTDLLICWQTVIELAAKFIAQF
jgi:lipopolysaccharide/colanic/teichoic acid biosynthesis glycosyltransferase